MKKLLFATVFLCMGIISSAQNFALSAKSGDTELDASLNDMNVKAKSDLNLFKKDLSVEFNVGEPKINKMLEAQLSPADVYMTLQVANMAKKDPDVVLDTYKANKDKGWGVIAKEMGIKPGSPEFHALKGKAKNKNEHGHGGGNGNGNGGGNGNGNGHGNGHGHGKGK